MTFAEFFGLEGYSFLADESKENTEIGEEALKYLRDVFRFGGTVTVKPAYVSEEVTFTISEVSEDSED